MRCRCAFLAAPTIISQIACLLLTGLLDAVSAAESSSWESGVAWQLRSWLVEAMLAAALTLFL